MSLTSLRTKAVAIFLSLWLITAIAGLLPGSALAQNASPAVAKTQPRRPTTFRVTMRDGLRFDPPRLSAQPGEEIVIDLENADTTHQMHNFIVAQPGKREEVVKITLELGEKGPERQFVPASPDIIVHSALLEPEKRQRIKFTLPKEPGIYPYVCTFPGHGMVMYGAIYAGVPMPPLDQDTNLPPMLAQTMTAGGGRRPFVQRMFLPGAGPAAIAVALPGDQNYCWDTARCRLRYVWSGSFIDASEHWRGNGSTPARLPTEPWWRAPKAEAPLRFGAPDAAAPPLQFLGYRLQDGLPEFRYRAGAVEINERITPAETAGAIVISFRMAGVKESVYLPLPASAEVRWSASNGRLAGNVLRLTPAQAAEFTLTLAAPVAP